MASDSKSDFTRTGVRRAGDDYQDVVALDLFVEWLEHPERYAAMRVEADDSGFLDDVVAEASDGVIAVQVKFSAHPDAQDDPWDLETLLAEREGKPVGGNARKLPSLLAKWATSVRALRISEPSRSIRARIISNRRPTPQFRALLDPEGKLQMDRISEQATRDELARQVGEEAVADVLRSLAFHLDHPGLDTLEDAVRRRFFKLGFDERGWLNLKDELRGWIRHRNEPPPDGRITLDALRRAAGWNDLRGLPQDFPIPDDYVLPSNEFHRHVQDILISGSSCIVLTGAPGFGKSTYASYLYEELRHTKTPVVRHHYYLFQAERALNRLEHRVAAESLMHDMMRDHGDALGAAATRQPDSSRLREFLQVCGSYYNSRGSRLVVLLDGLDHVWRERRSIEQLSELLDQILPVPAGVVLLVATQPVADEQLPRALLAAAPRRDWLWLPKLGPAATEAWVRHHLDALTDADGQEPPDHAIERVATAFFDISDGHPLHLRYSFRALRERGVRIDDVAIRNLPPCPTDEITDYYAALMLTLSQGGKLVLQLFASAQFSWPRSGLLDCLQRLGINRADGTTAVAEVMHLLARDALGLRTFHSSVLAFIGQQTEYPDNVTMLQKVTLEWLQTDAPDHWRWSYEWILQAAGGYATPLIQGPDREWAVEAVAMRRSPETVEAILSRSGWLACTPEHLPLSLERGVTLGYWADIAQFHQSVADNALFAQLIVGEDPLIRARLSVAIEDLTDREVYLLAESAFNAGDTTLVEHCFDSLRTRLNSRRLRSSEHDPWATRVAPVLATAALADEASSALRFSIGDDENAPTLVSHLVSQLVRSKQVASMRALWREVLSNIGEQNGSHTAPQSITAALVPVVSGTVLMGLEEGLDVDEVIHNVTTDDPLVAIYSVIRNKVQRPEYVPLLPLPLPSVRWFDATQGAILSRRLHDVFQRLLANHLLERADVNDNWLASLRGEQWAVEWLIRLDRAARASATNLVRAQRVTLSGLLTHFSDLPYPQWRAERDESPRQYALIARRTLSQIGLELLQLAPSTGGTSEISEDDIREAIRSSYFDVRGWIDDYLERRRRWLTAEALAFLLLNQRSELDTTIEHFYERANVYVQLAGMAALHGRPDIAKGLLRDAARNLLSHGYHKDMLLFHALEVVRLHDRMRRAASPTSEEASLERGWLQQLAVPIAHVTEFTDGDETHGLPEELADALGEIAPDLLAHYYLGLTADEEYDDASHAFRRLVQILPASDPIVAAVLSTAVDERARETLLERAQGDADARAVEHQLAGQFGPMSNRPKERVETAHPMADVEKGSVDPSLYPPDRLSEYVEALKSKRLYDTENHLERWLTFWTTNARGVEAFEAIRRAVDARLLYRSSEAVWRSARLLFGKDVAFDWLVRAQRESGWNKWFSRREESEARWSAVKTEYPERWFEFLQRSFEPGSDRSSQTFQIGHFSWVRLIDYMITVGQFELASRCVATMLKITMELVSAVTLSVPEWLRALEHDGGRPNE